MIHLSRSSSGRLIRESHSLSVEMADNRDVNPIDKEDHMSQYRDPNHPLILGDYMR